MAVRYDLDNRGGLSKYQYLHRCIRSDEEVKHLAAEQGISLDMLSDYCAHPSAKSSPLRRGEFCLNSNWSCCCCD